SLGFRVVALVDYDRDETAAAARLAALQLAANAVVRLPKGVAIEAAILDGLLDIAIVNALVDLNATHRLPLPAGWQSLTGGDLRTQAIQVLKSNNGLHAQFLDVLMPPLPVLAGRALQSAMECCLGLNTNVFVQL
ncbi:MAG: hypothetical protein ACYC0I_06665, partial [Acidimicrobiales bacterium]